ncbi:MAG: hypothetical protein JWM56_322 [Candidatus Peribacteria bacterium]|nr:hypothetical protein [Candidatus Peribacteria bacterium]
MNLSGISAGETALHGYSLLLAFDTGKLFLLSTVCILMGLLWNIWFYGQRLSGLIDVPLGEIERHHWYLPSRATIFMSLTTTLEMYIVAVLAMKGVWFHADSREWMLLGGLFVGIAVLTVLAELLWKSMAVFLFAFATGTIMAFFILLGIQARHEAESFFLYAYILSALISLVAWLYFTKKNDRRLSIIMIGSLFFWLTFHLNI